MFGFVSVLAVRRFLYSDKLGVAVTSFIGVLLFAVLLLLLVMFGYHITLDMHARSRERLRREILAAVNHAAVGGKAPAAVAGIEESGGLFNRRGVAVLTQVFSTMGENGRAALRGILIGMGAERQLKKELATPNADYLVELIGMVGNLDLVGLDTRVAALLYSHRSNIDLQYEGFLTLSRLGSRDLIVKLCTDKSFVQTLSFRSLQQILKDYSGDEEELCSLLLNSPDPYVVRICLKRIGASGLTNLAEQVASLLNSDNYNLLIDAVRTLGYLQYVPAARRIAETLGHERWEVRSVAVTALAAIAANDYEDAFVRALQDGEWQVRYNAGLALCQLDDLESVRAKVQASGDRYAMDMLEYMTQSAQIWRQGQ